MGHTTGQPSVGYLRVSRVMFLDFVRSDLRYSKGYYQSLDICKSSDSSVSIENSREMPQVDDNMSTMASGVELPTGLKN